MSKLKRISIDQLRLGMHVHEFCGSWLDHPFWRSNFRLSKAVDLARIVEGGVQTLWIDTAKGADVAGSGGPDEVGPAADAVIESVATMPPDTAWSESYDLETRRASAIVRRAVPKIAAMFAEARLGRAVPESDCAAMVDEISESVLRHPTAIINAARIKQRDIYTYLHSVAVCALMLSLGRQLGLRGELLRIAGMAGMMHDLGKVGIPLELLNKPGKLTSVEFELIKTHPLHGHDLLTRGNVGAEVLDVCLHHHERIDGTGYPHGLSGEGISLLAKMGAVCDVYDAVTSVRPYKDGWDPADALRRMSLWTGHFDPHVLRTFVKTVGIYPVGSLVRLQSGRLAVVTAQHPQSLLTPKVKVFFSVKSDIRIEPYEVDLAERRCADKIVGCEVPEAWNFKHLDRLVNEASCP